jgi:hypothetical protein
MYRMYFRDAAGINGRIDFDAEDDHIAMTTAELLADACSDKCSGFELWQDFRQLCDRRMLPRPQRITLSDLSERRQAVVIETEEAIKNSGFAIASSRRLLDRLKHLRSPEQLPQSDQAASAASVRGAGPPPEQSVDGLRLFHRI